MHSSHEAFFLIDVEFGVVDRHLGGIHFVERAQFSAALAAFAVLLLEVLEVGDGKLGQVFKIMLDAGNLTFKCCHSRDGQGQGDVGLRCALWDRPYPIYENGIALTVFAQFF